MKIASILLACIALSSCAGTQQQWTTENCTKEGAYGNGVTDVRDGKDMNGEALADTCSQERRAAIIMAYQEGYRAGAKTPQTPAPASEGSH